MVVLKQLGDSSVTRSGTVVGGRASSGRRLALLALLASARGGAVTRDKIVGLLWPESPTDRARHQLSDTLYILRNALGEDVVRSTGDDVALNTELVSSDVADFERLLDEGQLERAVEIFRGPLLDGFHLSDAAEFERWLDGDGSPHVAQASKPFGSGPRTCPGRSLALLEMRVLLATLLAHFEIERVGPREAVRERFSFTMLPEELRLRLRPRA